MEEILEVLLKLGLVVLLSGLVGLERELTGHKAGIRTLILVGLGSASLILISRSIELPDEELGRIISGVATGIGFLGAGAIIKEGINVQGLTTAASIWVVASIGVAIGSGAFEIGFIVFVFTFIVLSIFGILERKLHLKPRSGTFSFRMEKGKPIPGSLVKGLEKEGVGIQRFVQKRTHDGIHAILDVQLSKKHDISFVMGRLEKVKGIKEMEWEDTDPGGPITYLDRY